MWKWIQDWFYNLIGINLIMEAIENNQPIPAQAYLQLVFSLVVLLFAILSAYRGVYLVIGLFFPGRKFDPQPMDKRYAFVKTNLSEPAIKKLSMALSVFTAPYAMLIPLYG